MRLRRNRIPRRTDLWPRAWRRKPLTAAILLVLLVVAAWSRARAPTGSDNERYHNHVFTCIRAVDGDTIDLDVPDAGRVQTRIRLWGIDTPETGNGGTAAMHFGREAAAFTHSLVDRKPVRVVLSPDKSRDRYGRLLAYVYLGDTETMLNEELIAKGYGYADHRFPHVWRERFGMLEEQAQKKKAGLWREITPAQMPPWRQRKENGK